MNAASAARDNRSREERLAVGEWGSLNWGDRCNRQPKGVWRKKDSELGIQGRAYMVHVGPGPSPLFHRHLSRCAPRDARRCLAITSLRERMHVRMLPCLQEDEGATEHPAFVDRKFGRPWYEYGVRYTYGAAAVDPRDYPVEPPPQRCC